MSEETVARMRLFRPTDTPSVSTVLEEMFQFFDRDIRRCAKKEEIEDEDEALLDSL